MQHPSPPNSSPPIEPIKALGGLQTPIQLAPRSDMQCPPKRKSSWRTSKPYSHRGKGRRKLSMSSDICPLWRASQTQALLCETNRRKG